MRYQRELFSDNLFQELLPLLREHHAEVAPFQDQPLDPEIKSYQAMHDAGILYVFTARLDDGTLVGYSSVIVHPSVHSQKILQATQDVLFVSKPHRGFGRIFISWCVLQLQHAGVDNFYLHVNAKHNFGAMLESLGFELLEINYCKRLKGVQQ